MTSTLALAGDLLDPHQQVVEEACWLAGRLLEMLAAWKTEAIVSAVDQRERLAPLVAYQLPQPPKAPHRRQERICAVRLCRKPPCSCQMRA